MVVTCDIVITIFVFLLSLSSKCSAALSGTRLLPPSLFIICRKFATSTTARSGVYREKTPKEIWASDKGAWPVMTTFAVMITFVAGYGFYYMATSPDVRLIGDRRNQFLRGELASFSHRNNH